MNQIIRLKKTDHLKIKNSTIKASFKLLAIPFFWLEEDIEGTHSLENVTIYCNYQGLGPLEKCTLQKGWKKYKEKFCSTLQKKCKNS